MQQIQLESGEEIQTLEDGLLVVRLNGDDSLDAFLEQGGASTDQELLEFITSYMKTADNLSIETAGFGCSTLQAPAVDGGYYFGRNFDWFNCDALVVESHPKNGYASVSTVNTDFIHLGTRGKSFFMGNGMYRRGYMQEYLIKGFLIALIFGIPAGAIGALTIQRSLKNGFIAGFMK